MTQDEVWEKRLLRERSARKAAEKLLEEKSIEIWEINKRLEETIEKRTLELKEALDKANNANKVKDIFLSNMSHELRTPLNAIIGFSQIILAKMEEVNPLRAYITKIKISGDNLLALVNTLLDFSKIESGKMDFYPSTFSLKDCFNEIKVIVEPLGLKNDIKLLCMELSDESLMADKQLIKQVLINLITNAIKFSPPSSTVVFTFNEDSEKYTLSVADQGFGINPKDIQALFEPFIQVKEHQNISMKGTGLGLAISKKIITMHQGTIWVESKIGEGSTFFFTISKQIKVLQ